MDPATHKRFLEYRDRHGYFGAGKDRLNYEDWYALDAEQRSLAALGEARTDEEEQRFNELLSLLFLD